MTSPVFDFKAIARKLNCNEQKADFEEKNPKPEPNKVVWSHEWGYGVPVPMKSLAHPEWPYAGTAHEWRGFVKDESKPTPNPITNTNTLAISPAVYQKLNFGPDLS